MSTRKVWRRPTSIVIGVVVVVLISIVLQYYGSRASADGWFHDPSSRTSLRDAVIMPTLIPPDMHEQPLLLDNVQLHEVAPKDHPIVQIERLPADLTQRVRLKIGPRSEADERLTRDEVAFFMLTTMQYEGDRGKVAISLSLASHAVHERKVFAGSEIVRLPNGQRVWTSQFDNLEEPHRLVYLHDEYIVTITGNLSKDNLLALVDDVVITSPDS